MRLIHRFLVLTGLLAGTLPATAAPASEREPYVVPGVDRLLLTAEGSGRQYRIFIAAPPQPAPAQGYPVIYVLDGNAMFLTAVESARAYSRRLDADPGIAALVVGIGYPEGVDIPAARTFDLTPAVDEPRSRHPSGGADAFLDFIENELKPRIAREFPVDPQRQALMGHSLGGLFTLGVLTRRPQAFQTYVGMSASFWFGRHDLSRRVAAFAQARTAAAPPVRVLLTVGEFEQRQRPEAWARDPERAAKAAADLERRGQVTRTRAAAQQLAQAPGVLVDFREIAGEDHGTVIPAAVGRGVDFILNGPRSVPAVPTAEEYLRLGAEGRYRLRMQVRALPELHRIPWLNGLKAALENGLDRETHAKLHEERQEMDERYGSRPHEVNAD